jgi:hypothetical protein
MQWFKADESNLHVSNTWKIGDPVMPVPRTLSIRFYNDWDPPADGLTDSQGGDRLQRRDDGAVPLRVPLQRDHKTADPHESSPVQLSGSAFTRGVLAP